MDAPGKRGERRGAARTRSHPGKPGRTPQPPVRAGPRTSPLGTDIVRERAAINTALERNLLKTLTNTDIMEKTKTVPKNVTTHRCLHWRRDKVNATEGKIILKMMSSLKNNYFKMQ
ncbi:uncharacterized protein LJ206_014585 isoform 3-T4 [Theristicus caerulescens]